MDANLRAAHGLTLRDYEVLLWLSWAPDAKLTRGDLAQSVRLTEGGVTRLVAGLEEAGLVASVRGASDRRVIYAQLTESGRALLAQAARTHVADIEELFTGRLSTRELGMLSDLLGRLDRDGSGP
jgi:DNA-binding MarR family transcriptional regulator